MPLVCTFEEVSQRSRRDGNRLCLDSVPVGCACVTPHSSWFQFGASCPTQSSGPNLRNPRLPSPSIRHLPLGLSRRRLPPSLQLLAHGSIRRHGVANGGLYVPWQRVNHLDCAAKRRADTLNPFLGFGLRLPDWFHFPLRIDFRESYNPAQGQKRFNAKACADRNY